MCIRSRVVPMVLMLGSACCSACGPGDQPRGFHAADPAAKMEAIVEATNQQDRAATMQIIEQLDSDDPAVRLAAISALERATGQTLGYEFADAPRQRSAAVSRWVEWARTAPPMLEHLGQPPHGDFEEAVGHDTAAR